MKLITVHKQEEGQRLVKLLGAYLKEAPNSFFYKMLRKKNITLNGKKADGTEKLKCGDEIRLFLSDETYEKFAGKVQPKEKFPMAKLNIVYEDSNVIFINKPAGMLSQKSVPSDVSLNEYLLGYLEKSGQWKQEESKAFRPSVCNRLDRNTSGLMICGKSMAGLQQMAALLKDRSLHKYYLCLVKGVMTESQHLEGYLLKDENSNQVKIFQKETEGAAHIITEYEPLYTEGETTLLKVTLVTGKSHQIRAHLSSIGHPIIGDPKYGERKVNAFFRETHGIKNQMLHAWKLTFPELAEPLDNLSEKSFEAEPAGLMKQYLMKAKGDLQ
ncbi:RluA family pseudouridine synthase [Clostridiaceae bacterium Marseille-Q4145]|nr:RluA family pseudouridine synthase [Clostridiaceae bacterium Marseille-Q4145]